MPIYTRLLGASLVALSLAPIAACTPEPPADMPDAGPGTAVDAGPPMAATCGDTFPGPPMLSGILEDDPTYKTDVADIPRETIDGAVVMLDTPEFFRATVGFMLGTPTGYEITEEQLQAAGPLGDAVRVAIASATGEDVIDVAMLRRGLQYAYLCSRPLPRSLDELKARYGDYTTWNTRQTDCSHAKGGVRIFYDDPQGRVTLAETVEDGVVRETEVLFYDMRDDGNFDFAAYTEEGDITNRSTFATRGGSSVTLSSPYTCLTCHFSNNNGHMSDPQPLHTGAACRE